MKKAAALYTPETLAAKAAEVRRLLSRAVIAFGNPDVLDSVTRLALAHPEIAWEPVALAAAALNAQRDLDEAKARAADPLLDKVSLPLAAVLQAPASRAALTCCYPKPPASLVLTTNQGSFVSVRHSPS